MGKAFTQYRDDIARCIYTGTDRPDCLFASKEGYREMTAPTTGSLRRLHIIGRYLKKCLGLIWDFADQSN